MLCDALSHNSSVTSLDLSNNQLWGLRGAKELRAMLRRNGGLRTLLVPFCNIASPGERGVRGGRVTLAVHACGLRLGLRLGLYVLVPLTDRRTSTAPPPHLLRTFSIRARAAPPQAPSRF